MKSLKEFKREIKALGYRVKTYLHTGWTVNFTCLEVLDKEGNFVVGSGGNVYAQETIDKHNTVFDLLSNNRESVFDDRFEPAIKVKF